ncbi:MAG: hypothetical protein UX25_C0005G0016 [Candidatus Woesebacteria bacterium GW2011_GWC2_45_9]|uniref:Uncharacterized protein n=1 Tax=Candidatus Woesebacteria bacterium GW2011_GWC2_45_9 TaxID=1618589 RepID=A0A0G1QIM8_9BACT|nr:MAG: hypothetical protein UX25_C0005G0016 [Candidatus Woesebacteria bacterium GW2011_GWC2_45_9]
MAKSLLKLKARKMRQRGESVTHIASKLGVSKSTVSLWVRDIILNVEQLENLRKNSILGLERAGLLGALKQKNARLERIRKYEQLGIERLQGLTKREFLIAGLALYWGEGTKKALKLRFCNSDPKLINFMIRWVRECFKVQRQDLVLTVGINEIHRNREKIVKEYWSDMTKIALFQFRKTSFKKAKLEKIYSNFNEHYGTLTVDVLKPARYYYKILGLIEGLSKAGRKLVFRDVS